MNNIIVSRHPAAVEFIARELGGDLTSDGLFVFVGDDRGNRLYDVPVLTSATADDVRGKHVYGNLPLHLAALAAEVTVIEFGDRARLFDYHNLTSALREEDCPPGKLVAFGQPINGKCPEIEINLAPRGQEYTLADMDAAGAVLKTYHVSTATTPAQVWQARQHGGHKGDYWAQDSPLFSSETACQAWCWDVDPDGYIQPASRQVDSAPPVWTPLALAASSRDAHYRECDVCKRGDFCNIARALQEQLEAMKSMAVATA